MTLLKTLPIELEDIINDYKEEMEDLCEHCDELIDDCLCPYLCECHAECLGGCECEKSNDNIRIIIELPKEGDYISYIFQGIEAEFATDEDKYRIDIRYRGGKWATASSESQYIYELISHFEDGNQLKSFEKLPEYNKYLSSSIFVLTLK